MATLSGVSSMSGWASPTCSSTCFISSSSVLVWNWPGHHRGDLDRARPAGIDIPLPRRLRQRVRHPLVHEGYTYQVDHPEVLPIEAATAYLSASDQRFHRWFGINQCLRVRRVEPA